VSEHAFDVLQDRRVTELPVDLGALGSRQPQQLLRIEPPARFRDAPQLAIDLAPACRIAAALVLAVAVRVHVGRRHRRTAAAAALVLAAAVRAHVGLRHRRTAAAAAAVLLIVEHLATPPRARLVARASPLYTLHFRRSGLRSRRRFALRPRKIAPPRFSFRRRHPVHPGRRSAADSRPRGRRTPKSRQQKSPRSRRDVR
jgi:hypothetical protein